MSRWKFTVLVGGVLAIAALATPRVLPYACSAALPGVVFRGEASGRILYLTVDDAPSVATGGILAVLRKHQVPATFFVMSGRVSDRRQLTEIVSQGHGLGHHMRSSTAGAKLPFDQFKADFDYTHELLNSVTVTQMYRPPSGSVTPEQQAYAKTKGYTVVLGTVFPLDHWLRRATLIRWAIHWLSVRGGIVILHDGAERGLVTAEVLDRLIPEMKAKGYEFRLLNQTWPNKSLQPTATAVSPAAHEHDIAAVAVAEH